MLTNVLLWAGALFVIMIFDDVLSYKELRLSIMLICKVEYYAVMFCL